MSSANETKGFRLLIIDDNLAIHEDFHKILGPKPEANGFDAAAASLFGDEPKSTAAYAPRFQLNSAYQGQEGLELVKAAVDQGVRYAMASVDIRMPPGWDGIETTSKLWEVDPDLQIVICTAYSDYSWDAMLEKLGSSDRLMILKKPFDSIEVLQLANSLSRKWSLLQESKSKLALLEEMIVARTVQMVEEQKNFKAIFEDSPEGIFQITPDGYFMTANPALAAIYGYDSSQELMDQLTDIQTQLYVDPNRLREFHARLQQERIVRDFESEIKCKDGSRRWISETACKVGRPDGSILYYQGFVVNISAQKEAQKQRDVMESNLRHAQKLESVGQLAAGIAHEINTPIQYVGDNIRFLEESFCGLRSLLQDCQRLAGSVDANTVTPELLGQLSASCRKADLAYLCDEIPLAVQQSMKGVNHVAKIVRAMKEFSHPGGIDKVFTDLNQAIETTVTVARSEWKYVAEVVTDFAPDLPKVPCFPTEFNQVILNLIVNAAHAIGDVEREEGVKGTIKISTRADATHVEIRIADTGMGIPESIRHRIFDPFFTTKEVGKGTGQGLAIAWSTVVDKHEGHLSFESKIGDGTTFIMRLPLSAG